MAAAAVAGRVNAEQFVMATADSSLRPSPEKQIRSSDANLKHTVLSCFTLQMHFYDFEKDGVLLLIFNDHVSTKIQT